MGFRHLSHSETSGPKQQYRINDDGATTRWLCMANVQSSLMCNFRRKLRKYDPKRIRNLCGPGRNVQKEFV